MSSVPERDIVDSKLAAARAKIVDIPDTEMLTPGTLKAFAAVLVDCTEAVVRSIRDHDDTQATVIDPALREGFTDLTTVVGQNLSKLNDSLDRARANGGKGGLFG